MPSEDVREKQQRAPGCAAQAACGGEGSRGAPGHCPCRDFMVNFEKLAIYLVIYISERFYCGGRSGRRLPPLPPQRCFYGKF